MVVETNQILIFGGYLKMRESLYTLFLLLFRVNTVLNHIDTTRGFIKA